MLTKKYYTILTVTVLMFLFGYGWRSLYGLRYNNLYLVALILSVVLAYRSCNIIRMKNDGKRRWGALLLCSSVIAGILWQWLIVANNLTAIRELYTINYRANDELQRNGGNITCLLWDNQQYIYLGDNQVFDVNAEKIITYEYYVRHFQSGNFYQEVFNINENVMEIFQDGILYYSYQLSDSIENYEWSPKRNYLLINYKNNTLPELIDIKNKTVMHTPTYEGLLGPHEFKEVVRTPIYGEHSNGNAPDSYEEKEYVDIYYVEQIEARIDWNPQETEVGLIYSDAVIFWGDSICYWNLESGEYEFITKFVDGYHDPVTFDSYGNVIYIDRPPDFKWLDETHIAFVGGSGESDSFADSWAGHWKPGVVIKDIVTNKITAIYPSMNFTFFAEDIRYGYCLNSQDGSITKYRYRWL